MSAIGNPSPVPVAPPSREATPRPVEYGHEPPRRRWPWLGLLLIPLVALGVWQSRKSEAAAPTLAVVKTARVTSAPLVQVVRVTGLTSSRESANITAPIMRGPESGRDLVLQHLVESGVRVKKGQLLAQFDMQVLQDHIDDIGDDIEKAEADIKKRRAEQLIDIENLNQSIRTAKAQFEKAVLDARASEVRTVVDQELLKLAAEEAEAAYQQVQADVNFKLTAHKAELRILEITKGRHVRHRERHQSDLNKYALRSPMDGMAVLQQIWTGGEYRNVKQGDRMSAGQLFVKVVNPERMQVEGNINQTESSSIKIGQRSVISLDAFPGVKLQGKVISLAAIAGGGWRQQYYIRNVPVRISIEGGNPHLIPDLSAAVDVQVGASEKLAQIPLAAVHLDQGKAHVFVKKGASFEKRAVSLGEKNHTHAAVLSGLTEGEEVALEKPADGKAS